MQLRSVSIGEWPAAMMMVRSMIDIAKTYCKLLEGISSIIPAGKGNTTIVIDVPQETCWRTLCIGR